MTKAEKNLKVVSFNLTDGSGNEVPAVALVAAPGEALRLDESWQRELARDLVAAPGEALRLDEPWQRELARDLEWHYRPPYVAVEDGE